MTAVEEYRDRLDRLQQVAADYEFSRDDLAKAKIQHYYADNAISRNVRLADAERAVEKGKAAVAAARKAVDEAVVKLMTEIQARDYEIEFGVRPHRHNMDIYESRARSLIEQEAE